MSKDKEVVKEIHHYHYIPYPAYMPYGWQYPWYPRSPLNPTWVRPTDTGTTTPKITWTTSSTNGKGTTIKYGDYFN